MVENGARKSPNAITDLEKTRSFRRQATHVLGLTFAKLCVAHGSVSEEPLVWKKPAVVSKLRALVAEIALALDVAALPAQSKTDLKGSCAAKTGVETPISSTSAGTRTDLRQIVSYP